MSIVEIHDILQRKHSASFSKTIEIAAEACFSSDDMVRVQGIIFSFSFATFLSRRMILTVLIIEREKRIFETEAPQSS